MESARIFHFVCLPDDDLITCSCKGLRSTCARVGATPRKFLACFRTRKSSKVSFHSVGHLIAPLSTAGEFAPMLHNLVSLLIAKRKNPNFLSLLTTVRLSKHPVLRHKVCHDDFLLDSKTQHPALNCSSAWSATRELVWQNRDRWSCSGEGSFLQGQLVCECLDHLVPLAEESVPCNDANQFNVSRNCLGV
jgi:hypothetical protein